MASNDIIADVPRLADLVADDVVATLELVEDERTEFRRIDLAVSIAGAEIGEGARLAEVLGIEGAAELDESTFSSEGMTVSLERTADGKVKVTVVPEGSPASFFLRVKVK